MIFFDQTPACGRPSPKMMAAIKIKFLFFKYLIILCPFILFASNFAHYLFFVKKFFPD